jgi:hypothetical protein
MKFVAKKRIAVAAGHITTRHPSNSQSPGNISKYTQHSAALVLGPVLSVTTSKYVKQHNYAFLAAVLCLLNFLLEIKISFQVVGYPPE